MSYQRLVESHNRVTYQDNVKMVAQQLKNPLLDAVTVTHDTGEAVSVADLLGKKEYQRSEDRGRRNPDNPTPASRRWLTRPAGIEDGEYIDKERKFDQAMDPTSNLVKNSVATVNRGIYDVILGIEKLPNGAFATTEGGIYGGAIEGKNRETKVALPASCLIAHAGAGLNITKLRSAQEGMEIEDFGLEEEAQMFALITPKQKTDLLDIAKATSTNLNAFDIKQLESGRPTTLLGITWLFSNRVPIVGGKRRIALWTKNNVVANFWQELKGDMWNDTSAKNMPYIYTDAVVAATRAEDAGVRFIDCDES